MAEKLTNLKLTCLQRHGSIKATHDRLNRDSERITLARFYRVVSGYTAPTKQERKLLCQVLQKPARELFPEA